MNMKSIEKVGRTVDDAITEALIELGTELLKEDEDNSLYIFNADDTLTLTLNDASYAMSDTLSF